MSFIIFHGKFSKNPYEIFLSTVLYYFKIPIPSENKVQNFFNIIAGNIRPCSAALCWAIIYMLFRCLLHHSHDLFLGKPCFWNLIFSTLWLWNDIFFRWFCIIGLYTNDNLVFYIMRDFLFCFFRHFFLHIFFY